MTSTSLAIGAGAELVARDYRPPARAASADVVALRANRFEDARPSRVDGAPLAGAQAINAYRATAAVDAIAVLSRIDARA